MVTNENIKELPRYQILLSLNKIVKNPIPLITETMEKHGNTYITYLGGVAKTYMTIDPQLIQHVLQKNHKNYFKPKLQTESLAKFVGHGLLTINGDYWLKQRRMIQPSFHREKIQGLVRIMNTVASEYVKELKVKLDNGQREFEMHYEMSLLTLRMVSRSLFSDSITIEDLDRLNDIISVIQFTIAKEIRQSMFAWWRKLTGETKRAKALRAEAVSIIEKLIENRRKSGKRYDDMLDMLLHSKYEGTDEGMTNLQIVDEVMIIFVAGFETTANALSWQFFTLFKNQGAQKKLREEIKTLDKDELEFMDIPKLPYAKQVMAETMRLYPPAWLTSRVALEDDEIDGLKIDKGDLVGLFIYGCHHNKDSWERVEEFDPERFSKEQKKDIVPYSYFPFSGGPRLCIGVQFAETEMQIVLHHLYKHFKFELVKDHPIELQPLVTLRPKHGIKMLVSKV